MFPRNLGRLTYPGTHTLALVCGSFRGKEDTPVGWPSRQAKTTRTAQKTAVHMYKPTTHQEGTSRTQMMNMSRGSDVWSHEYDTAYPQYLKNNSRTADVLPDCPQTMDNEQRARQLQENYAASKNLS